MVDTVTDLVSWKSQLPWEDKTKLSCQTKPMPLSPGQRFLKSVGCRLVAGLVADRAGDAVVVETRRPIEPEVSIGRKTQIPGVTILSEAMLGNSARTGRRVLVWVPCDSEQVGSCVQNVGGSGLPFLPANSLFQLVSLLLKPQHCRHRLVLRCQQRGEDLVSCSPDQTRTSSEDGALHQLSKAVPGPGFLGIPRNTEGIDLVAPYLAPELPKYRLVQHTHSKPHKGPVWMVFYSPPSAFWWVP